MFARGKTSEYVGDRVLGEHQARSFLVGDWSGERTMVDFFYVAYPLANPVGDSRPTGWGRTRGAIDIDFGKRNVRGNVRLPVQPADGVSPPFSPNLQESWLSFFPSLGLGGPSP